MRRFRWRTWSAGEPSDCWRPSIVLTQVAESSSVPTPSTASAEPCTTRSAPTSLETGHSQSKAVAAILDAASAAGLSQTTSSDLQALSCKLKPGLLEIASSDEYGAELPPLLFVAGISDPGQQQKTIAALRSFAARDWAEEGVHLEG